MNFESGDLNKDRNDAEIPSLSDKFNLLEKGNLDINTFTELEMILEQAGFEIANKPEVVRILNDTSLLCRNESFTTLMDLVEYGDPINLNNPHGDANVCKMSNGNGFRAAMTEGFAGKDVGHHIKTVISFIPDNLDKNDPVNKDNNLWELKPNTAEVSRIAAGIISKNDLRMISCRFPVDFYPNDYLNDEEDLKFIVRHYIKNKPRTE